MTFDEMKAWIDKADYQSLLAKWRCAAIGSPWFQGKIGKYYSAVMARKCDETPHDEKVAASKATGWAVST